LGRDWVEEKRIVREVATRAEAPIANLAEYFVDEREWRLAKRSTHFGNQCSLRERRIAPRRLVECGEEGLELPDRKLLRCEHRWSRFSPFGLQGESVDRVV
jgi:hypothetical protein|tara:strand:+ start:597 stop:899 length:303 start_codon:yes stop_codon:yes gene_type:complete